MKHLLGINSHFGILVRLVFLAPLLWVTSFLTGFVPRSNNIWVFGSYNGGFVDNSKYLFLHIIRGRPEIEAIWITNKPETMASVQNSGGKAYLRWSIPGVYYAIRAKYWFVSSYVSDINTYLSTGATLINLWHGVPLKRIERDITAGPLEQRFRAPTLMDRWVRYPFLYRKPDYVLSSSKHLSRTAFTTAFSVPEQRCLDFGYPRNDAICQASLIRDKEETLRPYGLSMQARERIKASKMVILYMPTWRDGSPEFLRDAKWDFKLIDALLQQMNYVLLMKLHVLTPENQVASLRSCSNIIHLPASEDVYPLFGLVSVLMSDYSSVYFDFLLTDKPIVFLPFDLSSYKLDSRGFYFDYEDMTPGPKYGSAIEAFENTEEWFDDKYRVGRELLRKMVWKYEDGKSSERLVKFFLNQNDSSKNASGINNS